MDEHLTITILEKIKEGLTPFLGNDDSSWNALSAAFQLSIIDLLSNQLQVDLDEEGFTACMLGAIETNLSWTVHGFLDRKNPQCFWNRYRKEGGQPESESKTGADFALLIREEGGPIRLALFQAKKFSDNKLAIHQRSKKVKTAHKRFLEASKEEQTSVLPPRVQGESLYDPQFVRLYKYAFSIQALNGSPYRDFNKLSWVHYLGYEPRGLMTYAISQMRSSFNNYEQHALATTPPLNTSDLSSESLFDLLTKGSTRSDTTGWLELNNDQVAAKALNMLIELTDVYEATVTSGALKPLCEIEPVSKHRRPSRIERSLKLISDFSSHHQATSALKI